MGFISTLNLDKDVFLPYLNTTATLYDLGTGAYIPTVDGHMALNGGIATTNGYVGRPQRFKSTVALTLVLGAACIYRDLEVIIYDTEFSLTPDRIRALIPNQAMADDVMARVVLINPAHDVGKDLETFHAEVVLKLANDKIKRSKDYMVTLPFIDPKTGKARTMLRPTIVVTDSWSRAQTGKAWDTMTENLATDSATNMMAMYEGNVKTKLMGQMPNLGNRSGIYFVFTAHMGDKFNLNPMSPSIKDQQYMKQDDKIKGVGSNFGFLTSALLDLRNSKVLQDSKKECNYPLQMSHPTEVNQVEMMIVRGKNNSAGGMLDLVMSQNSGILNSVTNFHYLKEGKSPAMLGGPINYQTLLQPKVNLTRTNIREKAQDYETSRALEILTQLVFIQTRWTVNGGPVDFRMSPDKFAEKLMGNKTPSVDDILNSRGYWTYSEDPRKFMSLYDILEVLQK